MDDKAKAREEYKLLQQKITEDWKAIYAQYPHVIDDLLEYTGGLAASFRRWAEDQEIAGAPIDDHKVSQLLQQARTCDTVKTYITSRIDQNVAQPIKKSK